MKASRKWVYAVAALVVGTTVRSGAPGPAPTQARLEAVSQENESLTARQQSLRRTAFDLSDEVYRQIEQDRRALERAGLGDPAWHGACPPLAIRTDNEAVLAWLSKQSSHVRTLPPELAARP